jgi:hypothetical protein
MGDVPMRRDDPASIDPELLYAGRSGAVPVLACFENGTEETRYETTRGNRKSRSGVRKSSGASPDHMGQRCPWVGRERVPMRQSQFDDLARNLDLPASRRFMALVLGATLIRGSTVAGKSKKQSGSVNRGRKRRHDKQRGSRDKKDKEQGFSRDCHRFVIAAGPDRDDKFQHIDDDLLIELIAKGKKGGAKTLLEDDNDEPNGANGAHLKVNPFTARVGDRIHVVARNEEAGGCELDEIWIHCIEGRGGRVKLFDAVTPEECRGNANRVGVFVDETVRIKNK